jgi:hypothetical protein
MTRFFVIASTTRGVIEPAEILEDADQYRALYQLERDQVTPAKYGDTTVLWDRKGQPFVDLRATNEQKRKRSIGDLVPRVDPRVRAEIVR